jgi:hypothetical protein
MQTAKISTLVFTLRRTWPDGGAAFTCDGLDGTLYLKKGLLAGEPPQSLQLTGSGLGDPVAATAARQARKDARKLAAAAKQPVAVQPVAPQPATVQPAAATRKSGKKVAA